MSGSTDGRDPASETSIFDDKPGLDVHDDPNDPDAVAPDVIAPDLGTEDAPGEDLPPPL